MNLFASIMKHFRILGFLDFDISNRFQRYSVRVILNMIVVFLALFENVPLLWFCVFDANNFGDLAEAFLNFCSYILLFGCYIAFICYKSSFFNLHNELETIIENRMRMGDPRIATIYETTQNKVEGSTEWFSHFMFRGLVPGYVLPIPLLSLYKYFTTGCSNESLTLILPASLPYKWQTLYPYIITCIVQGFCVAVDALLIIVDLYFFIGFCRFSMALATDVEQCSRILNGDVIATDRRRRFSKRTEWTNQFYNVVRHHVSSKNFVARFSDVFGPLIITTLTITSSIIISTLVKLNMSMNAVNVPEIVRFVDFLLVFVGWAFLFCYFGHNVSHRFMGIGDSAYDLDWHLYPLEIRKHLPLMIQAAQNPVYLQGFANVQCTRESFRKIMRFSYSFFTMLRRIEL